MTRLAFLDTETTGLDPDLHEIWEVGLILREDDGPEGEYRWMLPVDLGRADPVALRIGGFHERHHEIAPTDLRTFAQIFASLTRGCHLVGAVISFDEERLRRLLRRNGACPEWHYHLIDVEALAVGYIAAKAETGDFDDDPTMRAVLLEFAGANHRRLWMPPWSSRDITAALGLDIDEFVKHTALGDAAWARAIFDRVMSG